MYLLDTNIISYLNSDKDIIKSENIKNNFDRKFNSNSGPLDLYYSVICYQETLFGLENAKLLKVSKDDIAFYQGQVDFIQTNCKIIDYNSDMANRFSKIKSFLIKQQGTQNSRKIEVRNFDIMIAATALECGFILITNNVKDFKNIPDLQYEDWTVI